ncbi:hypothetical protein SAMN02745206_00746 [Desulfacinum infernum DSM 9756]|jgi:hypothetical protein|uniref:Uncharacterized protein n=1 Tax=Desulfacinum infernum DSM 9756 TaxID=1121391 RepID=A0A1M4VSK5_9BACT|nr:hypothetical protein [Desulfacinum infernum]SHE72111.1 hypothetical protein SAMN02745206_00746 [Desulfacinum infernum DSM 9756]
MMMAKPQRTRRQEPPTNGVDLVPNPVLCREGRGIRHFACVHYDACLDKAAKGMWTGFTCAECGFYNSRERE